MGEDDRPEDEQEGTVVVAFDGKDSTHIVKIEDITITNINSCSVCHNRKGQSINIV